MAFALKTIPKNPLFFDCFGPPRKQSRNSLDRNNVKQLKNKLKHHQNSHQNSHRNSRNNSLREGETVSLPRAHPLSTRTEQPSRLRLRATAPGSSALITSLAETQP
jgi:hypothetical protein